MMALPHAATGPLTKAVIRVVPAVVSFLHVVVSLQRLPFFPQIVTYSPVILRFDLKLIATKGILSVT